MGAPIWLASPPEVHSALLSSGPGPGPLLAAATAWSSLSTEYAAAATELTELLAGVQADAWQGAGAQRYASAHGPYLGWLSESAAKSTAAAALHQTVAGGYNAALASMPTLAELAANHAVHTALVATNFFGINTVPIALNEADYARMWVQAAETMIGYQAVTESALAAMPVMTAAPAIRSVAGEAANAAAAASSSWQDQLTDLLSQYTHNFAWPLGKALYPDGWPFDAMAFTSGISSSLLQLPGMSPALASALAWTTFHTLVLFWPAVQASVPAAALGLPALIPVVGALGAIGAVGAAGVIASAELPVPAVAAVPTPGGAAVNMVAEGCACLEAAPGAAAAPAPGVAGPAALPGGAAPAGGGPGVGFGPTHAAVDGLYVMGTTASSAHSCAAGRRPRQAAEAAPQPDAAAGDVAALPARERTRRQRAKRPGHSNEFMDMTIGVTPDWAHSAGPTPTASRLGAGTLGFAGTVRAQSSRAAGLATVARAEFDGAARSPMVPASWAGPPA